MEELNTFQQITNLIERVGFPILVSGYLLYRFEVRIKTLEQTIKELNRNLQQNKN